MIVLSGWALAAEPNAAITCDRLGRRDRDARSLRCGQNNNRQTTVRSPRIAATIPTLQLGVKTIEPLDLSMNCVVQVGHEQISFGVDIR